MSAEKNVDIIRMAQQLERQLAARGALGRGLGEYARSLRGTLPEPILHDIMKVNRVRNDLVHRNIDQPLSDKDRASLRASYERAAAYLESSDLEAPQAGQRPKVKVWGAALALLLAALLVWLALTQGPVG